MRSRIVLALTMLLACTGCEPPDPQSQLEQVAAELASTLPEEIPDTNLTLVEVKAAPSEVYFLYEFTGATDEAMRAELENLKKQTEERLQQQPNLDFYVENKVTLTYVYRNAAQQEVLSFSLRPWML